MINTYSLGDYKVTFTGLPGGVVASDFTLGGYGDANEGSFTDSISLIRNEDLWSTEGDYTGSWVHNKNMNATGAVVIRLRQVSDKISIMQQIAEADRTSVNTGIARTTNNVIIMTVIDGAGQTVGRATDCHIQKIPDQVFGNTAEIQEWRFTAGQVLFGTSETTDPADNPGIVSPSDGESTGE